MIGGWPGRPRHATGLNDYRDSAGYREDAILTPADAVTLGSDGVDLTTTVPKYASPNYLLAGLVIERVTGQPLSEVLAERLFIPLGMDETEMVNNQRAGFVGQASGGVVSTVADLGRWYQALMRDQIVLSPEMRDEMLFGGIVYQGNAGLGAWRHCPCEPGRADDPSLSSMPSTTGVIPVWSTSPHGTWCWPFGCPSRSMTKIKSSATSTT